jgi:hypothetical protein
VRFHGDARHAGGKSGMLGRASKMKTGGSVTLASIATLFARTVLLVALTLTLTLVPLPAGSSEQSGDTLKDAARREGGTAYDYLEVEMPFASLSQVVSAADVILRARITSKDSRLTQDERFVRTYFAFNPSRIFKDKLGIVPTRNTPRMTTPWVFIEPGGVVHVDSLRITMGSNASADPPLKVGEDVLLFLSWDKDANAFRLQNGPYGLLRIRDQSVDEANKETHRQLRGKSRIEIEGEIDRLVKGTPRTSVTSSVKEVGD